MYLLTCSQILMQRLGNGLLLVGCKIGVLRAAPAGILISFLAVVLHAVEQRLLSKCLLKFSIVTSTSRSVVCPKSWSRQLSDRVWSLVLPVLHYLGAALLSRTPMGTSSSRHCTFFSCLLSEEQKENQSRNFAYNWYQDFKVRSLNLGFKYIWGCLEEILGIRPSHGSPWDQSCAKSAADWMWPRTVCTQSFICFQSALRKTAFSQFRCDLRSK